MFAPNGFVPSSHVRKFLYDEEGRLLTHRPASQDDNPALAEANSLYATDAEVFGVMPPFLAAAKRRDSKRRNYIVQPGGACIYFEDDRRLADPWDHNRVQYTAPDERESFGHNSMDGTKMSDPRGRALQVGGRSGSTGGR